MNTKIYSTLFSCIYDEPEPVGNLGRGTHYSVFRSVEWLGVTRSLLPLPQVHDFAVIWDEDHDRRIIDVIEAIYMEGLLSPIQFIGERKGVLTVIVAAKYYYAITEEELELFQKAITDICSSPVLDDSWHVEIGMFDRDPGSSHQTQVNGIISDDEHRAITYLRNIDSLWSLGTKYWPKRFVRTLRVATCEELGSQESIFAK